MERLYKRIVYFSKVFYRLLKIKLYKFYFYNLRSFFLWLVNFFSDFSFLVALILLILFLFWLIPFATLEIKKSIILTVKYGLHLLAISYLLLILGSLFLKFKVRVIFFELLFVISIIFSLFFVNGYLDFLKNFLGVLYEKFKEIIFLFPLLFIVVAEISKRSFKYFKTLNYSTLVIISFIFLILFGSLLLMLPISTYNGISFVNALFTATSAVCVTGLTVLDTATNFTFFGKTIILILIQIGGLGIMTFTTFFAYMLLNKSSFKGRLVLKEIMETTTYSEITKNLIKIILFTFIIELLGAIVIYLSLQNTSFTEIEKIKFSIFHSISAFCNAGFTSIEKGLMNEVIINNYLLILIIAFLIILGSIGYPVLLNLYKLFKYYAKNFINVITQRTFIHNPNIIDLNSKIIVKTTFLLLTFSTLLFLVIEYNNVLKDYNFLEKLLHSFFMSVTPRTAGFNTVDYSLITHITGFFVIFLMWIGGAPSSTAGGIKVTTFFIAILNVYNLSKGNNKVEYLYREISHQSLRKAFAAIFLSLFIISFSFILLVYFDGKKQSYYDLFFETVSAFSTVGLTMGITSKLSDYSKIVLVLTMFIGRLGFLSFFMAFLFKAKSYKYKYPEALVIVN